MDPLLGMIVIFAGNFAPAGWMFCNGQLLPISQYTALFSILGTTYGGDGRTTFALPDLRGRVAVGQGQGPGLSFYNLGQQTGTESVTLSVAQMPSHSHLIAGDQSAPGGHKQPGPNHILGTSATADLYSINAADTTMNPASIVPTGGNQPTSIIQPVLGISYIIAINGIFPSRN